MTRLFRIIRDHDESGVSGTGHVADGAVFSTGATVINWLPENAAGVSSIVIYHSLPDAERVHGHGGKTRFVFEE
jgi:hypothetical protein